MSYITPITRMYVRTTRDTVHDKAHDKSHDKAQVSFVESVFKTFAIRCPIMFVPSVLTYTNEKRRHVYKHNNLRLFTEYRNSDETVPTYDDYQYAIDHWNIWTTIARQEIEDRVYRDTSSDIYMILDNHTEYYRSLSNSSLLFNQVMRLIKESNTAIQEVPYNDTLCESHVLRDWDMILLSHRTSIPYTGFDKSHFVYINSAIGIPSDHIHFNGNYLLSSRGLHKLISSRFNENLIPLPEFIHKLHDGTYPITRGNSNDRCRYLNLFHTVRPVFNRWTSISTSIPYRCNQITALRYQRIHTTWSFIIAISPFMTNGYAEYIKQYGLFYGIPVIQIDFEGDDDNRDEYTAISILANLHDVYCKVNDPENIIVLYCGNQLAFPNCIPSVLLERFIGMKRPFVYCKYSTEFTESADLTIDEHIANGIWMTKFDDLFLKGSNCSIDDIYNNLREKAHCDASCEIFFDITHVRNHVSVEFDKEIRQIVFTENTTKREIRAPFVSSSIYDADVWIIFIKLYNMIQTHQPVNLPFEINPDAHGNNMFKYGKFSTYMSMTRQSIRMYKRAGIMKWVDMIHNALTLPEYQLQELRYLYIRSTHREPIFHKDASSSDVPYQWAYNRGFITHKITIYMRSEEDYNLFMKTFQDEIASMDSNRYIGIELEVTYTSSFIRLLLDDLSSNKLSQTDYLWFVSPSHVFEPGMASRIAETQRSIIAPCVVGRNNNYTSASCYNEISGNRVVHDGELAKFISRQSIGVWNMVYIQDTWCIHSTMFDRIKEILATEKRDPNESWEQFFMRIFHNHYIPVYACNRYKYGIDVDY